MEEKSRARRSSWRFEALSRVKREIIKLFQMMVIPYLSCIRIVIMVIEEKHCDSVKIKPPKTSLIRK